MAPRSEELSSVITIEGPSSIPLRLKASWGGITLPNTCSPLLIVDCCSSEVKITPKGIPEVGVAVDKMNTDVLKRSKEEVESQKTISPAC